ncbi:ATP-binding cassette domain-containing protein [Modestobacter sp. I12A-02628]|uniref:ABC transporter ATP-binding protein n=1 Tax=Goekera deserti TaxID=2497753 RepID=A0A7K3WH11_9ACTN|nr:ABC transporter ATP-binding protein [Goekera deserti]MPR00038.1 ATP-binding cassette domain-containing protein [Goekera deserti]NDI49817.1 ATP-binding cassette domain-containing protein [Goekera deserti]NEL55179.1 ABC transporter ATP-binding protein [Goekera deserti]
MATKGLIIARDLVVGYGTDPVCAPVSVAVTEGTALGVVGPNGAGKSTVLQTMVGLLAPISGSVQFDGRDVDEREAGFRRDVATVLDDDAFFPSLTGQEHLLLTARGHGVDAAEDVVAAEIAEFGLQDRADALPSALSSGQRRRLALAAAFVRPARLLVLDEPERRLDTRMRRRLAERLREEVADGLTVVFASHDPEFLATLARRVLIVGDDACRLTGPAEAVAALHEG